LSVSRASGATDAAQPAPGCSEHPQRVDLAGFHGVGTTMTSAALTALRVVGERTLGAEPARELVLGLLAEVAVLRERVDEHKRLLKRDSTNSSLPPSRDPLLTRQQRALARERASARRRRCAATSCRPSAHGREASSSRPAR
jgi:hypothetical protein